MRNIFKSNRFITISVAIILSLLLMGISTQTGYAASFACDKATTSVEKMICSNPGLSQLDEKLATAYREALEKLPQKGESLREGQRQWLREKRNKCSDAQCLESAYKARLSDIKLLASGSAAEQTGKQQDVKPTANPAAELGAAQKYPPYPDVWEREFFDYLPNNALFVSTNTGEVIVGADFKIDRNGETIKDDKGNLISLKGVLAFFEGAHILDPYEKFNLEKGKWAYGKRPDYYYETHSCSTRHFKSKDILITGNSKINWIDGLAVDRYKKYGSGAFKKEEIDGIQIDSETHYAERRSFGQHTMYYIKPVILEKKDDQGKILWQKVYMYFHPWWASYLGEGDVDSYSFFYFKKGCITLIDEVMIFLHFDGTKKIFRLDKDGNPRTHDKNLLVIDYKNYKAAFSGVVSSIDAVREDFFKAKNYIESCDIDVSIRGGKTFYTIGDYDFFGEKLGRSFGIEVNSREVKQVMSERTGLDKCIKNYNKLKTIKGGH